MQISEIYCISDLDLRFRISSRLSFVTFTGLSSDLRRWLSFGSKFFTIICYSATWFLPSCRILATESRFCFYPDKHCTVNSSIIFITLYKWSLVFVGDIFVGLSLEEIILTSFFRHFLPDLPVFKSEFYFFSEFSSLLPLGGFFELKVLRFIS